MSQRQRRILLCMAGLGMVGSLINTALLRTADYSLWWISLPTFVGSLALFWSLLRNRREAQQRGNEDPKGQLSDKQLFLHPLVIRSMVAIAIACALLPAIMVVVRTVFLSTGTAAFLATTGITMGVLFLLLYMFGVFQRIGKP